MTLAVDIYKNGIKLASGTATNASASLTSVTELLATVYLGRNVQVTVATAGTNAGSTWRTRILTDGVTSLTLADACPFS